MPGRRRARGSLALREPKYPAVREPQCSGNVQRFRSSISGTESYAFDDYPRERLIELVLDVTNMETGERSSCGVSTNSARTPQLEAI